MFAGARRSKTPSPIKTSKIEHDKAEKTYLKVTPAEEEGEESEDIGDDDEEEGIVKRRGRRRRKRGRDSSRGPPAFQSSLDPETQIATIGLDSHNPSARPSLVPTDSFLPEGLGSSGVTAGGIQDKLTQRNSLEVDSFLDIDSLKLLRRELDEEVIDNEFNLKRRKALEEALRTIKSKKRVCQDLEDLKREFKGNDASENFWLNIPRIFSRSSARFELPMDSRVFSVMKPLEYVAEHVRICSSRKQLYNHIFNLHKNENELENEHQRILSGKNILPALNAVMSMSLGEEQGSRFCRLVGWKEEDNIEFKTFCGLAALCERLLAPDYPLLVVTKKDDPCHEIETIDFKSLEKKLEGQNADERLVQILYGIRDS